MRCGALVVLVLLTGASQADDTIGEVADRVVAAVRDDASATLERLVSQARPDPWLVAEELRFRGAHDAAAAFVAAVKDSKLAAYVASRRREKTDKKARQALAAAERLRMADSGEEAWAMLRGIERPRDPVLEIRLRTTQGEILRDLERHERSDRYFFHAGKLAHGLGWRRRAAETLRYPAARACLRGASIESTRRQLKEGEATVCYGLAQGEVLAALVTTKRVAHAYLGTREAIKAADHRFSMLGADEPVDVDDLRRILIEPLELAPEIRRLFIVTDYHLAGLPFVLFAGDREIVYGSRPDGVTAFRPWKGDRGQGVLAVAQEHDFWDKGALKEAHAVGDAVIGGDALTLNAFNHAIKSRRRWRALHVAGPWTLAETIFERWPTMQGRQALERWESDLLVLSTGRSRTVVFLGHWKSPRRIQGLWSVDRKASRALMTEFYALWNGEAALPACTALKRAQDHVRSQERWKDPVYWAGWQLWAEPDRVARPEKRDG